MSKKNKPINIRTCIVTNEKFEKNQLIRIVIKDGNVSIDLDGNKQGRGYYIQPKLDVLNKAIERKIFQRKAKISLQAQLIEQLKKYCK